MFTKEKIKELEKQREDNRSSAKKSFIAGALLLIIGLVLDLIFLSAAFYVPGIAAMAIGMYFLSKGQNVERLIAEENQRDLKAEKEKKRKRTLESIKPYWPSGTAMPALKLAGEKNGEMIEMVKMELYVDDSQHISLHVYSFDSPMEKYSVRLTSEGLFAVTKSGAIYKIENNAMQTEKHHYILLNETNEDYRAVYDAYKKITDGHPKSLIKVKELTALAGIPQELYEKLPRYHFRFSTEWVENDAQLGKSIVQYYFDHPQIKNRMHTSLAAYEYYKKNGLPQFSVNDDVTDPDVLSYHISQLRYELVRFAADRNYARIPDVGDDHLRWIAALNACHKVFPELIKIENSETISSRIVGCVVGETSVYFVFKGHSPRTDLKLDYCFMAGFLQDGTFFVAADNIFARKSK